MRKYQPPTCDMFREHMEIVTTKSPQMCTELVNLKSNRCKQQCLINTRHKCQTWQKIIQPKERQINQKIKIRHKK